MDSMPGDAPEQCGQNGDQCPPPLVYTALSDASKYVRLLWPRSMKSNDILPAFDMTEHSIDDLPAYAAISYVWGTSTARHKIVVEGSYMEINRNALSALKQARTFDHRLVEDGEPSVALWMDTICINQQDLHEKALQVEMMAEIYGRATSVYSCVGPHEDESDLLPEVFDALRDVYSYNHAIRRGKDFDDDFDYSIAVEWLLSQEEEYLSTICGAFARFAHRPYWSRMWIVQELYMGEDCIVMCGNDTSTLSDLQLFEGAFEGLLEAELPDDWRFTVEAEFAHMSEGFMSSAIQSDRWTQMGLGFSLRRFKDFKCRDSRDRIYALNSMIQWGEGQSRLRPDYAISTFDVLLRSLEHVKLSEDESSTRRSAESLCEKVSFDVMEALEIDASHPQMRAAVADLQRRSRPIQSSAASEGPTLLRECSYAFSMISGGPNDRLTVSFHQASHEHEREASELLDYLNTIENDSSALGGIFKERIPQRLFVGPAVAGLVCNAAKKGDCLYPLGVSQALYQRTSQLYIVLRRQNEPTQCSCSIVGQAMIFASYQPDVNFPTWSELEESEFRLTPRVPIFEIALTAADVVVLIGQDFTIRSAPAPSSSPWPMIIPPKYTSPQEKVISLERFARLATAVTFSPGCGARLLDSPNATKTQELSSILIATDFAQATRALTSRVENTAFLISQTNTGLAFMEESVPVRFFAGPFYRDSKGPCVVHGSPRQLTSRHVFERDVQKLAARYVECTCGD
ncbi:hypothetical protein PRZ48_004387 [Zasmidium cellare]|uniref:Heterokaryon incompatibility domain-containing protein n=1 Tax=Zasmidium cellare TaxID=395010 RepID=A0ABR0EPM7_ZASCE|nr:hypothetical protein PRZ48_004387 [Zasmidium cellare]